MLTNAEGRRSTPLSRIFVEEICPLKPEQNEVALFASTNYKTNVRVGTQSHEMSQVKRLIDTVDDPNLVSTSFLHLT